MTIKLSMETLRYIAALESTTGAEVKDCIANEDSMLFVVKEGQLGRAIGKNGSKVKKLTTALGKKVHLVEFSPDPVKFVGNLLSTIETKTIKRVKNDHGTIDIHIEANFKSRGAILGKGGKNIQILKEILKRHHNVNDVVVK